MLAPPRSRRSPRAAFDQAIALAGSVFYRSGEVQERLARAALPVADNARLEQGFEVIWLRRENGLVKCCRFIGLPLLLQAAFAFQHPGGCQALPWLRWPRQAWCGTRPRFKAGR